ncbi:MAG: hydrogenase maturation protease, partial [Planctomycetes bacterium]|nr:hydrogenase maturation protease [Planctomycetota bacterium]
MNGPRVLVAGIGNIFLGDDAFGVEVARRLADQPQPEGVRVVDFGIRGLDLAYALLEDWDLAILVDATPRGHPPGTLYLIQPDLDNLEVPGAQEMLVETHGMNPLKVLRLVLAMGGRVPRLRVVGCEPGTVGTEEDPIMGLSPPVQAAVEGAIQMIQKAIQPLLECPRGTEQPL